MTLTLSDIYGKDKTLFWKYPEPGKDSHHGEEFDFYAWEYWPEVIHTEEGRILPVIGHDIQMIIGKDVLHPDMIEYYNDTYPETFSDKNIVPYSNTEYYNRINSKTENGKLIVAQPYNKIQREKYYIDPEVIYNLNDKTKLHELTNSIPKREICSLEEIKTNSNFPYVLKSNSWATYFIKS